MYFLLLPVQKLLEFQQEAISFDPFSPIFFSRLFYFSPLSCFPVISAELQQRIKVECLYF
jgi:hypothetical protein